MIVPAMTSADGNIYALSDRASQTANQVNMRLWIFQPFLDTLGMEMPTTTEEFYQYLVGVRDRNPNGNGRRDEIPLVGSTTGWQMRIDGFLMNAFTFNDHRHRFVRGPDGRISTTVITPEWRQGLEYMRRLNAEGLLASESFTLTQAQARALVEVTGDPIVGSITAGGHHNFTDPNGIRYTQYRVANPLRGPNGVQQAFFDEFAMYRPGRFAITRDSQIPEIALKWVDYHFSADFFTRNRYGVLGRDWHIPPPGTASVSGGQARYEEVLRWGTPQNAHWANVAAHWDRFASYDRAVSPDPYELEIVLWNARVQYWPFRFMHSVPPDLPFTMDEARIFNSLSTSITDYVNQSMAQFVVGNVALNDQNWSAYVQNIERLGLGQLLQVTQSAFDRSWAEALGYRR
jgi:putative aldouronate transport system substrate-binding protein